MVGSSSVLTKIRAQATFPSHRDSSSSSVEFGLDDLLRLARLGCADVDVVALQSFAVVKVDRDHPGATELDATSAEGSYRRHDSCCPIPVTGTYSAAERYQEVLGAGGWRARTLARG